MVFNAGRKDIFNKVNIHIDDYPILKVKCTKFLGVFIDSDFKWSSHINGVLTNISKIIGIMGKLQGQLPKKILLLLYNSLILPHLSYCNVIWGACIIVNISQIVFYYYKKEQ